MKKQFNLKKLWQLFYINLYISAFTFGGGFVIVSIMKKQFVDKLHWFDENEMLDITAIAQSCPGAIAVNASILVGYRCMGVIGAAVSTAATIIPPVVIISVLAYFYKAFEQIKLVRYILLGMQAGVAAVVVDVVNTMAKNIIKEKSVLSIIIMSAGFIAAVFFNVNVVYIILVCIAIGIALSIMKEKGVMKK